MINTFTMLPTPPSRIGDPDNFGGEALAFLAAQPQFVTEANMARTYLNTLQLDPFNWGIVNVIAPARVEVTPLPNAPIVGEADLAFVAKADGIIDGLFFFVQEANPAGVYIDALADLSDPYGLVMDDLRPVVPVVQPSQLQEDAQAIFDSKAFAFYGSLKPYAASFGGFADYVYMRLVQPEDFGSVADPITIVEDWGTL